MLLRMGQAYVRIGLYDRSFEYRSRDLAVAERIYGNEDILTLQSAFEIGSVICDSTGKPKSVRDFFPRSTAESIQTLQ